jgi:hypothetical protein
VLLRFAQHCEAHVFLRIINNKHYRFMEQKYFCTYKNASTNGAWIKSREYDTVAALFAAMQPYIEKHPMTTVQYQHTR